MSVIFFDSWLVRFQTQCVWPNLIQTSADINMVSNMNKVLKGYQMSFINYSVIDIILLII